VPITALPTKTDQEEALIPPERNQDPRLEADGVLVRPIGGQIYLIEEGAGDDEGQWGEENSQPDRSPLSGLINRH
jgi:hypothetical protein